MRGFLERNAMLVAGLAAIGLVTSIILGILVYGAREAQEIALTRVDIKEETAIGPKGMISDRSKLQIDTMMQETPHVLGGWATKLNYEKTENPILHAWMGNEVVKKTLQSYIDNQLKGRGFSSAELNAASQQSLRNSEEAKTGLIKCGPLEQTNLPRIAPEILGVAKAVCRATIPPFDEKVNLGIVVVIDIPANENTEEIQAIRRMLLRIQIDIYNRDYQGRETWIHEGSK